MRASRGEAAEDLARFHRAVRCAILPDASRLAIIYCGFAAASTDKKKGGRGPPYSLRLYGDKLKFVGLSLHAREELGVRFRLAESLEYDVHLLNG